MTIFKAVSMTDNLNSEELKRIFHLAPAGGEGEISSQLIADDGREFCLLRSEEGHLVQVIRFSDGSSVSYDGVRVLVTSLSS